VGIILDIGCGANKHTGAVGVDRRKIPGIDVVCDFGEGLPFRQGSVTAVYLHNIVEHMPDLIAFMVELYRICEPDAKLYIRTPYYASREAFVDPTHVRYITEATFEYFDYPNYYGLDTNIKIRSIFYKMRKPFRFLPRYFQKRCRTYLWNACIEMDLVLEVIKPLKQP
jgi:predicted SAM-dependent methyltransferase